MKLRGTLFLSIAYGLLGTSQNVQADQHDNVDLFDLSLEELLDINVNTGSLFEYSEKESASGITVIDREKIEVSGAKNLANLLEQHVPGLVMMTHSEGDKIGLRGQIAAENYKLLLLVNGKNMTNYVYEGAITEIDQWELGDIERVEVISGPGSVTYGTGAIAGVINIITKKAEHDLPTFSMGLEHNPTYQSTGLNAQYSENFEKLGVYSFISYRETDGLEDPDYYVQNPSEPTDNRYLGKASSYTEPPQDYQVDTFGRPQMKAHIGLDYGDSFSSWLRFAQGGQSRYFGTKQYKINPDGSQGELINGRGVQTRSLAMAADYNHTFNEAHGLRTSLTLDSQEYVRYNFQNPEYEEDHANNVRNYAFSQNRLTANLLYDYTLQDRLDLVVGYEYSYIDLRSPWGKGDDDIWIREGVHMISSEDTSTYTQDNSLSGRPNSGNIEEIGSGLDFHTHTNLFEAKYNLTDNQKLVYAHRIDLPDIAKTMYSPRLSWISHINGDHTVVSTLQRAQRMMPLRAQYLSHKSGDDSKNETLDSIELSYTNTQLKDATFNVRGYYNDLQAVGFTGQELKFLSDVELFGLDFVAKYKQKSTEFVFNHAYIKPLSVKMNENLKDGSNKNNISFADYYYETNGAVPLTLEDYGSGLNNIPQNISKFLFTQAFLNDKLKLHLNGQIYWDFEGSYDEVGMYQQAYDNYDTSTLTPAEQADFDQQKSEFERERALMEKEDAYEIDYNLNASVSYLWEFRQDYSLFFKFYVENMLNSSNRYYVSTGSTSHYPSRLKYLEKPVMYGFSMQFNYK